MLLCLLSANQHEDERIGDERDILPKDLQSVTPFIREVGWSSVVPDYQSSRQRGQNTREMVVLSHIEGAVGRERRKRDLYQVIGGSPRQQDGPPAGEGSN